MEKENKEIDIRYIITPYQYAVRCCEYSLQQQGLLFKVSEYLQGYFQEYIDTETAKGRKMTSPLFSDIQMKMGLPTINIPMSELNIDPSNTAHARNSLNQLLAIPVSKTVVKENGDIIDEDIFLFRKRSIKRGSTIIKIELDMEAAAIIFDMRKKGYISHPDDIALAAKKEKTPALYILLKRETKNWKYHKVKISPLELKMKLGLIQKTPDGEIKEIKYPRFSKFKQKIIEPLLEDLDRMKKEGRIECSFEVEYDYMGRSPKGDPAYIYFGIKPDEAEEITEEPKAIELKNEPKTTTRTRKPKAQQTELQFTEEEPQYFTPYKERAPYIPEYEEMQKANPTQKAQEYESNFITDYKREVENAKKRWQDKWDSFVGHYNGRGKEILAQIKCNGISSVSIRNISVSYPDKVQKQLDKLKLTDEEWEDIVSQLNKHKFVAYGILGIDRTEQGKNPAVVWRRK